MQSYHCVQRVRTQLPAPRNLRRNPAVGQKKGSQNGASPKWLAMGNTCGPIPGLLLTHPLRSKPLDLSRKHESKPHEERDSQASKGTNENTVTTGGQEKYENKFLTVLIFAEIVAFSSQIEVYLFPCMNHGCTLHICPTPGSNTLFSFCSTPPA